jgi:hypothetical protein
MLAGLFFAVPAPAAFSCGSLLGSWGELLWGPSAPRHVSGLHAIAAETIQSLEPGTAIAVITKRGQTYEGMALRVGFDAITLVTEDGTRRALPWHAVQTLERRPQLRFPLSPETERSLARERERAQRRAQYVAFTEREERTWNELTGKLREEVLWFRGLSRMERLAHLEEVGRKATQRILDHFGIAAIGAHYNLHGGQREQFVESGGLLASYGGDIEWNHNPQATKPRWGTYLFETGSVSLLEILNESNPSLPFLPSRMGHVLVLFDVEGPFIQRARAEGGASTRVGTFQEFNPRWLSAQPVNAGRNEWNLIGYPWAEFLAPPLRVFDGLSRRVGLRLSRAEENLVTLRYLESLLLQLPPRNTTPRPVNDAMPSASAESAALRHHNNEKPTSNE